MRLQDEKWTDGTETDTIPIPNELGEKGDKLEEDTYDDTRPADEDIPDEEEGDILFSMEIERIEETFSNG